MKDCDYTTTPYVTSIKVAWDSSKSTGIGYLIKYRVSSTRGDFSDLNTNEDEAVIDRLVSGTEYNINVYQVDDDGDIVSLFKACCTTIEAKENKLKTYCKRAADRPGCPAVYKFEAIHTDKIPVPTDDVSKYRSDDKSDHIYVYDIIAEYEPSTTTCAEKTLLMLGATGTGKSTLIESLINYISDVSYLDDYRFSIVRKSDEERQRTHLQHESQTTSVTLYRIPYTEDMKVNCRVNIIDTPGFNDTRNTTEKDENSKHFDKRIEMQLKHLFESRVDHLDAILIVVPLGETRLTGAQKHIFSSIVKLFGSDVKQNIFIAMTRDDGGDPDCLNVIKAAEIPYEKDFRFNNSNVFTKQSPETGENIWKERNETFNQLFKHLETAPKTSVKSSVLVMNERMVLQLQLEALKDKLSELTHEVAIANTNTEKIAERPILPIAEYQRQYTGKSNMNCTICQKTCHANCWVPFKIFNFTCEVFTSSGCLVCDNKCDSDKHIREKYKYKLKYRQTYPEETAVKKSKTLEESLSKFKSTIAKIEELIKSLRAKALKDCVLHTELYIQELIKRENKESQEGYQLRVNVLNKVIDHLKTGESILKLRADNLTN